MGDNDRRRATRSRVNFAIRYTMHRQQRFRSSSSSPSSLSSLPFWTSRLSVSTVSLLSTSSLTPAPTRTRTRTRTSTPTPISTLTPTPTPTPILTPAPTPIPIQPPTLTLTSTSPLPSLSSSSSLPSSLSSSLLTSILPSPTSPWSTSNISPYSGSVQQTCPRLSVLPNESPITSPVSIPCPRLASVLAWSVTLLLVSSCIGLTDAGILNGHPLGKRSFIDIQCKGIYDKSIFARLDRICEDCYNLFREPQLHQLCRKNCFTSDYFKGCLDVLLLQDEVEKIQTWIKQLHGAEPGV